jgi:hypothetical protein
LASESRSARRVKGLAAILRQEVRAVQVGDWQGHYLTDVLYSNVIGTSNVIGRSAVGFVVAVKAAGE